MDRPCRRQLGRVNHTRMLWVVCVVASSGLLGCSVFSPPVVAPVATVQQPAPVAVATLSTEAAAWLVRAEARMRQAERERLVWTAAVEKLQAARLAAQMHDSASTSAQAREVIKLCDLAQEQAGRPPMQLY